MAKQMQDRKIQIEKLQGVVVPQMRRGPFALALLTPEGALIPLAESSKAMGLRSLIGELVNLTVSRSKDAGEIVNVVHYQSLQSLEDIRDLDQIDQSIKAWPTSRWDVRPA